jgi:hypothetical protein
MKTGHIQNRVGRAALWIGVCALSIPFAAAAEIEPAARALARSVAAKLGSAQTIRLKASHKIDPAIGVGSKIDAGPLEITVKRPNHFFALQRAGEATRELAYDGNWLCLMHPELKHHALEPLKAGTIEQFADRMDERFGFRPPVAELLSADPAGQLFLNVKSAKVTGTEWVGWTKCERLHFEQDGMTGDLWVAKKDGLPRRYQLTFTGIKGHPTWDIKLTRWELNPRVDETLFSKRPAADSQKVKMLKTR